MVLVIDNYDSFTFNLVQYLGELGADVQVRRNDAVDVAGVRALAPARIVVSPGPGRPESAGVSCDVIRQLAPEIPILGVCLGHQAIGHVFGGQVVAAPSPRHGKTSAVVHDGRGIFQGLSGPFDAARYHSLVVASTPWPDALEVAATADDDGVVMGLRHRQYPLHGVQFHPESVLTADGRRMLRNFLECA